MSNVPLGQVMGLRVHRELIGREMRAVGAWEELYGNEALVKKRDVKLLQNLGKFEKLASMPMPLEVQLRMLRAQRMMQAQEISNYEKKTYPTRATYPVSAVSVSIFGEGAWHKQRPDGRTPPGHPGSYRPMEFTEAAPYNMTKRFNVNGTSYERVCMSPLHAQARTRARGGSDLSSSMGSSGLTVAKLTTPIDALTKSRGTGPLEAWSSPRDEHQMQ